MFRGFSISAFQGVAVAAALVASGPANATLALTSIGIADGFQLTTFVSGYHFGVGAATAYGPLAQGILPNGNVITGSVGDLNIYVFTDVDGQTLGSAVTTTSYTCQTVNCNWAMTTAGGEVYGAQVFGGIYEHFTSTGSFSPIPNLQGLGLLSELGMWGNPVNGHIIAAANVGLVDIDPVAGAFRTIVAGLFPDGVSVSPDGKTAWLEVGGNILAYDIAMGNLLHAYSGNGHGPDGTGVISGGTFDGFIVVNNVDGTVGLIDPVVGTEDIIASGGTRGDFVSPDPSNGTLFLSQFEEVARLSCGPGCSFAPPVPEPAGIMLLGTALLVFGGLRHRRRR